jgi:hypothetical protein
MAKNIELFPKYAYPKITSIWETLLDANWMTRPSPKEAFPQGITYLRGDKMRQKDI